MRPPISPVFLQRRSYRRRRLIDAARFLPVLGGFALLVPLLWPEGTRASHVYFLVFAVWAVLIVAAMLLARGLARSEQDEALRAAPGERQAR